jgi:uncharacterized protein YaaQ
MKKLIIAIIRDDDKERVSAKLTAEEFRVTQIASTGGFLRSGRSTLLIGVEERCVPRGLEILRENCTPAHSPEEKKATVFVLNVDEFTQL